MTPMLRMLLALNHTTRCFPGLLPHIRYDVLQGSQCFTCTVGMKISKAQYYLEDTDAVVNMMQVCRGRNTNYLPGMLV